MGTRVIAIDWSGAVVGASKHIWLAEVDAGRVVRLENGRTREQIGQHLLDEARCDPHFVVGFDFAFSSPAWFVAAYGLPDAPALWGLARTRGEQWLANCQPPFWGQAGSCCPRLPEQFMFRRT